MEKLLFVGILIGLIFLGNNASMPKQSPRTLAKNLFQSSSPWGAVSYSHVPQFILPTPFPSLPQAVTLLESKVGIDRERGFLDAEVGIAPQDFYRIGPEEPFVKSKIALVADLKTGEEYFAFGAERRWPVASITKLASAAFAWGSMPADQPVTFAPHHFIVPESTNEKSLKVGDTYTARDLIRAMLVSSSNEAAEALATAYGRANFIAGLNAIARELDLHATYFSDPTGLSPANQSTARDLAKITLHLYERYPDIFDISRRVNIEVRELNSGRIAVLTNTNVLAGDPGLLGGKTGYTDEAQGNLLTVFSYAGRPVLFLVMGSEDRFGDTESLTAWFGDNFRATQ